MRYPTIRALALAIGISMAISGAARAEIPLLRDSYYETGALYSSGGVGFGTTHDPMVGSGLHIYERNGYGGKIVSTVIVATLMVLGASGDKEYLGSEYGAGYRVDYYRQRSAEEMAQDAEQRQAAMDATAKNEYQMDLQIFWPSESTGGKLKGFSWSVWPGSWSFDAFTFELGFLWARTHGPFCDDDDPATTTKVDCRYSNFGSPIRFVVPVTRFATVDLQWDLNWLGMSDHGVRLSHDSPVRAELTLSPVERLYVRGGVSVPTASFDDIGVTLVAGVRF
jgi:hypothetical protein